MPLAQGSVGPLFAQDGALLPGGYRAGKLGDLIVSELHGRFYEQVYRGNVYSIGCSISALSATTITLTASSTPILGIWNPSTSGINAVLLQALLTSQLNTTTAGACGVFVWAASAGNTAISTGQAPFNRKTFASSGSAVKGFSGGATALTGITNSVVVIEGAPFVQTSSLATAALPATAIAPSVSAIQNFDGGVIVPPGGLWVLLNTTSVTTVSVAGTLMWEEVPV